MRRLPPALLAVPALALARLLPATGVGLGLRLAAATACALLPGALISECLGTTGFAPVLAWTMGALLVAMTVVFVVHTSFWIAFWILCGIAAVAVAVLVERERKPWARDWAMLGVLLAGIGFGIALWHVAGFDGDAFFHLGRTRKLLDFPSLSLKAVDEFRDGGLHPGYAFPLWHGFVALVARLAGVDPVSATLHLPTVLAPLSFVLFYEAGKELFESEWAGVATVCAQVALTGLAAGHGGSYRSLDLPPAVARQLLLPAVLALVFSYCRGPTPAKLGAIVAGSLGLALVHPSYAVFICVPLFAFFLARALIARAEIVPTAQAVLGAALPTAAVVVWLLPLVDKTAAHDPGKRELRRAFHHYAGQLVGDLDTYRLAAPLFSRSGAVPVAALMLIPLAALAIRRRWASYVLAGSVSIFLLTLVPYVFPRVADAVTISQARRLAGFVPVSFALVGGVAVVAGLIRYAVVPLALGASIVMQLEYPGVFGYRFEKGPPAFPAWIAFVGGALALVAALFLAWVFRRRPAIDDRGPVLAVAVGVFVLPVALHGFADWTPNPAYPAKTELTHGLVHAVRHDVPRGNVVFADPQTSYLLGAFAPVYIVDGPVAHVADTKANDPKRRLRDAREFFRTAKLSIPRRYGAKWIVVDSARHLLQLDLPPEYVDGRYVLYRLR